MSTMSIQSARRFNPLLPPRANKSFLPLLSFLNVGPSLPHALITALFLAAAKAQLSSTLKKKQRTQVVTNPTQNEEKQVGFVEAETKPEWQQRAVGMADALVGAAMLTADGPHVKGVLDGLKIRRGAEVIGAALVSAGIYSRAKSGLRVGKEWALLAMFMWAGAMDWATLLRPAVNQIVGVEEGLKQLLKYLAYIP